MINALYDLSQDLFGSGDESNARKVKELIKKYETNRLEIALCGHFSAGKSSLLNFLCEKRLLPTSPIPTSANLVRIAYGDPRLEVEMGDKHIRSTHPLTIELLDEWCRNGEDIRSVEIYDKIPYLQDGLGLLDTPGVDSTDPAHKQATEAALHLADAVFYVMDYNHVQSELNFTFVKDLQELKKPIVLIVNQIDKHREEELSFEDFRNGTKNSFASWDIHPLAILYVSVKVPDHPYSEWGRLKTLFNELRAQAKPCMENNIAISIDQIIVSHIERNEERENQLACLEDELTSEEAISAQEHIDHVTSEISKIQFYSDDKKTEWKKIVRGIVDDANLTPAIVRDALSEVLESLKPGFKVGFLSSAKKVENEKHLRMTRFIDLFEQHVTSNAIVHLQKWVDGNLLKDKFTFESPICPEWVVTQIGSIQMVSGEFVLNTSRTLAEAVRQHLRSQANEAMEHILAETALSRDAQLHEWKQKLVSYQAIIDKKQTLNLLLNEKAEELQSWKNKVNVEPKTISINLPESLTIQTSSLTTKNHEQVDSSTTEGDWKEVGFVKSDLDEASSFATHIEVVANELAVFPWLDTFRNVLMERASRMKNQTFLFSLFGAFSAGKSSFANALIGASVLPVSPNPTTATINKIVPVTDDHPHETAWIKMKSADGIFDDVRFALKMLGLEPKTMQDALTMINQLKESEIVAKAKPHFSFVQAVRRGYEENVGLLGQRWLADIHKFRDYAAKEWLSCFVEEIAFAYECPLTSAGVMLVDTPGADSIHARHTGVAFKFIKEADAVFFVTYYNHAFSQADREFIQQLGRVKEQFELDKMFFIINASDLASDVSELNDVINHVTEQLQINGVKEPKIYPVSSLLGLQAQQRKDMALYRRSGMITFSDALVHFVRDELEGLAINAGKNDLMRVIERLDDWLMHANQDAAKQEAEFLRIHHIIANLKQTLFDSISERLNTQTEQEIKELLFHLKNRITYRFGEWFISAFHPSLWATGGKDHYRILNQAWNEVLASISYALSQELLATTLRIEQAITKLTQNELVRIASNVNEQLAGFTPRQVEKTNIATPEVNETFEIATITGNWLGRYFKNAKSFFEGDGRTQLKLQLEPVVEQALNTFIGLHQTEWTKYYQEIINGINQKMNEHIMNELHAYEESVKSARAHPRQILTIQKVRDTIKGIL